MRSVWKKVPLLSAIGFVMGLLVASGFMVLGGSDFQTFTKDVLLYFTLSGLYGAFSMGLTVVYEIEEWGVTRTTLTHFSGVLAGFLILGFTQRWFSLNEPSFYIMIAAFILVYFVIWLVQYLKYRQRVKQLNQELKAWKSRHQADSPKEEP